MWKDPPGREQRPLANKQVNQSTSESSKFNQTFAYRFIQALEILTEIP